MRKINKILTEILLDPYDKTELQYKYSADDNLISVSNKAGTNYKIINGTINFTVSSNYTDNFGDQWTRFPRLQLDSFNGTKISEERFFASLSIKKEDLNGKLILDVGCGTGRFSEIAIKAGAIVVGLDYSSAAYVAAENMKNYPNFIAIRGDMYNLPFRKGSFDFVYCLGVLQHTPDVEKAFKNLPPILKSNGSLVVDYYQKRLRSVAGWKYIVRVITSRLPEAQVLKILNIIHPIVYPISNIVSYMPFFGKYLARLLPVVNYRHDHPQLNKELQKAWSFLDTYDNWAPRYDKPQTIQTVTGWANDVNLQNIEVDTDGHLVVRGKVS